MEFYKNYYGEEMDKDQFMSLQGLMKSGGAFKSEKQAKFILWKWTKDEQFVKDSWLTAHEVAREGFKYVLVDGFLEFGHGRGKGHRPVGYAYELDAVGVVARYRCRFTGDGDSYSLKSVEKDWERETPAQPLTAPEKAPVEEKPVSTSEWVGEVGKRLTGLKLTVVFVKNIESEWGVSTIHKMKDVDGNMFTWFSSSKTLELGKSYSMNGTVKKHEEFRDEKQTTLTRCMKIEEL